MEHQDWNSIHLNRKNIKTDRKKDPNRTTYRTISKSFLELDSDNPCPPAKIPIDLKIAIQKARCEKRMTQKELATMLNVSVNVISEYENGRAIPNKSLLMRMGNILNAKFT